MIEGKLRPIGTAPRDGTFVLVAAPSGYITTPLRVEVCAWCPSYNAWLTHSHDRFTDGGEEPTLWHPLLEIPSPEGVVYMTATKLDLTKETK